MSDVGRLGVVVPTFQRRDLVVKTVQCLAAQSLKPDEVVAVVDGSTDGTAEALRGLRVPFTLRVITQPHRGLGAARNLGLASTTTEWVVLLDDDMQVHTHFLEKLAAHFDGETDVVIGHLELGGWLPDTIITREARSWQASAREELRRRNYKLYSIILSATAVRRMVIDQVGSFDEELARRGAWGNEDIDFAFRLLRAGARFEYEDAAVAVTEFVTDPSEWIRRYRQLGRADVLLVRKHPELADAVLGRYATSRIYRMVAPLALAAPWIRHLIGPLRVAAQHLVRRGRTSWWVDRTWFTVRTIEYWAALASAGGSDIARSALAQASVPSGGYGSGG